MVVFFLQAPDAVSYTCSPPLTPRARAYTNGDEDIQENPSLGLRFTISWGNPIKTQSHNRAQNRKYITYRSVTRKDRPTVTGNVHHAQRKKFSEVPQCSFRDILADRHTDRQTDRETQACSSQQPTLHPYNRVRSNDRVTTVEYYRCVFESQERLGYFYTFCDRTAKPLR